LIIAVVDTVWAVVGLKPGGGSGLGGVWARGLCDAGAVLCRLGCRAAGGWSCGEFVMCPWMMAGAGECMEDHIFELRRKI